jgi:hypothetical protein
LETTTTQESVAESDTMPVKYPNTAKSKSSRIPKGKLNVFNFITTDKKDRVVASTPKAKP